MSSVAVVLNGPKIKNGRKVFESFVEQNKMSFWNRELVATTESLEYNGFMRPATVFISGDAEKLQVLKDAWARRILKPASGYTITSLGDIGAIQQIEQMHFVPLGDVICDAIAQLNRAGHPATDHAVLKYVARHCAHVAPPGIEMVRQTITSLLASGFIYKMGEHFFVSVPTNSPPRQKATVECQTGASMMVSTPQAESKECKRRGLFSRLFSKRPTSPVPPMPQPVPPHYLPVVAPPPPIPAPMLPATLPPKNKFPTYHAELRNECRIGNNEQHVQTYHKKTAAPANNRRTRRKEPRLLSSSSECLNYGPIDPPELLPGSVEVIDDIGLGHTNRRQKRRARREAREMKQKFVRTSTPIESDSAYSPSPVTDSNEELGCHSDPEINHTYINLVKLELNNDSTQFEDLTCAAEEKRQPRNTSPPVRGLLISNL